MPTTIINFETSVRMLIRDWGGGTADAPVSANYVFTNTELDAFIQSAVTQYSKFRPRRIPWTFNMIAQQSQYTLPNDWIHVDDEMFNDAININSPDPFDLMTMQNQFASFVLPNINNAYPLYQLDFEWYDSDLFVIVNPIPQSNASINAAYWAYHQVNTTESTVPQIDYDAVTFAAASRALDALAVDKGQKMQKYKIGQGLQIDDSLIAERMQQQAQEYWKKFENQISLRPFGV